MVIFLVEEPRDALRQLKYYGRCLLYTSDAADE